MIESFRKLVAEERAGLEGVTPGPWVVDICDAPMRRSWKRTAAATAAPWREQQDGGRFDLDDGRGLRAMFLHEILSCGRGFFASVNQ